MSYADLRTMPMVLASVQVVSTLGVGMSA